MLEGSIKWVSLCLQCQALKVVANKGSEKSGKTSYIPRTCDNFVTIREVQVAFFMHYVEVIKHYQK